MRSRQDYSVAQVTTAVPNVAQERIARWLSALLMEPDASPAPITLTLFHAPTPQALRLVRNHTIEAIPPAAEKRGVVQPYVGDDLTDAVAVFEQQLLPLITARLAAGQPLVDVRKDDLGLFDIGKRLIVSFTEDELRGGFSMLSEPQQQALAAFMQLFGLRPRPATPADNCEGPAGKPEKG